jgi:hypothetical protein
MDDFTRRQLVTGSAAAALGMAANRSAAAQRKGTNRSDGKGWFELECAMKETVLDDHRVRLRAYTGSSERARSSISWACG